jgi:hypothetical protein
MYGLGEVSRAVSLSGLPAPTVPAALQLFASERYTFSDISCAAEHVTSSVIFLSNPLYHVLVLANEYMYTKWNRGYRISEQQIFIIPLPSACPHRPRFIRLVIPKCTIEVRIGIIVCPPSWLIVRIRLTVIITPVL